MIRRALILTLIITAVALSFAGCSNEDGNEWQRLVCEVESVNDGAPLVSAYIDVGNDGMIGGDDDTFPIDYVPVKFRSRPYSSTITLPETGVSSWFHITNYDIIWHPSPNAPPELTEYNVTNGMCDAIVPVNDNGVVMILVADRHMKDEQWYRDLQEVPDTYYTAACELVFKGHESGSSEIVEIPAGLMVSFIGAITSE